MKKKSSPVWLIILLGAIIFVLGWIILSNQSIKQTNLLNQEIQRLYQELEAVQKGRQEELEQLKIKLKEKETTPSGEISPSKLATPSGE